ncbi:hypothetical protein CVT26_009954 [Gymnopilus dilepis]|uniref:Uncharacterized protein n=1 Tax=Gymnopilus dilepis TaxID=231916 RepID=A0A409VLA6_9AGAR|nr:hypothetical protein CVT26_009954 [Gymnopilus dilepis]
MQHIVSFISKELQNRQLDRPCSICSGKPCNSCTSRDQLAAEIQDTQEQLAEIDRTLSRLLTQHLELISQANQTHCALILGLPLEISSYIFELCIPALCGNAPDSLFSVQSQALNLGAVCKGWRRIALSTPRLYTVLPICLGTPRLLGHAGVIETWLHRSKGLPLSIYLYDSKTNYLGEKKGDFEAVETYRLVASIADLLKKHTYRWKLLDVSVPAKFLPVINAAEATSPVFHTLRLCTPGGDHSSPSKYRLSNFKPVHLTLESVAFDDLFINVSNITHADLRRMQISACLQFLQQAPALTCFKLSDIEDSQLGPFTTASTTAFIVHPILREFEYENPEDDLEHETLFDRISFPALEKLSISLQGGSLPTDTLSSFFARSTSRIKELHIRDCWLDNSSFPRFLGKLPTLTDLHVIMQQNEYDSFSPEELFLTLAKSGEPDRVIDEPTGIKTIRHVFLPNLKFFKYTANIQAEVDFPWASVPNIFGPPSAWFSPLCRPLTCFHLEFPRGPIFFPVEMDIDVIPSLLALRNGGIHLTIERNGVDIFENLRTWPDNAYTGCRPQ